MMFFWPIYDVSLTLSWLRVSLKTSCVDYSSLTFTRSSHLALLCACPMSDFDEALSLLGAYSFEWIARWQFWSIAAQLRIEPPGLQVIVGAGHHLRSLMARSLWWVATKIFTVNVQMWHHVETNVTKCHVLWSIVSHSFERDLPIFSIVT